MNGNNILKCDKLSFEEKTDVEIVLNNIENICIDKVIENAKQDKVSNVYITMLESIRNATKNEKIKMIMIKAIEDIENVIKYKDAKVDEAVPLCSNYF